jgi:hypothetical protein
MRFLPIKNLEQDWGNSKEGISHRGAETQRKEGNGENREKKD